MRTVTSSSAGTNCPLVPPAPDTIPPACNAKPIRSSSRHRCAASRLKIVSITRTHTHTHIVSHVVRTGSRFAENSYRIFLGREPIRGGTGGYTWGGDQWERVLTSQELGNAGGEKA
eukprot:238828-Prorocentrum_minimum.AAC.1